MDSGFIDSFRFFSDSPNRYSWWSYRANSRANNKGWRIDYIMVSNVLSKNLIDAKILHDIYHSDHCPISVKLNF
jgi:exodeoxyribonuclease-3